MIPNIPILSEEITEITYPGRTYKINFYSDILKKNKDSFGLTSEDALTIDSTNNLTGFTIDDDGVISLNYNAKISGYELSQDESGNLALTLSASLVDADRIDGYIDNLEAVIQAVYLILGTERYRFIIYSWDYGVEFLDLFGKPMPYVMSEVPRRIKDALIQDDRIEDVVDFNFEMNKKKLHTSFTVVSNVGNISAELEVSV